MIYEKRYCEHLSLNELLHIENNLSDLLYKLLSINCNETARMINKELENINIMIQEKLLYTLDDNNDRKD